MNRFALGAGHRTGKDRGMCECFDFVNAKLVAYNGTLEFNMLGIPPRAMIAISKRSKGKKPPLMEATFCPFCGEEYQERESVAKHLAKG